MIDHIYKWSKKLLAISVAIMAVVIIFQVISRNIFDYTLVWAEELAKYMLVWSTFIGASVAVRDREMAALDLLDNMLKGKWVAWHRIILQLLSIFFLVFLAFYGTKLSFEPGVYRQVSPAMRIPVYYLYMSIPISAVLMIIYMIEDIWKTIRKTSRRKEAAE